MKDIREIIADGDINYKHYLINTGLTESETEDMKITALYRMVPVHLKEYLMLHQSASTVNSKILREQIMKYVEIKTEGDRVCGATDKKTLNNAQIPETSHTEPSQDNNGGYPLGINYSGVKGSGKGDGKCFTCGESGHFAK